jgi:NAD(P)-dependent dehydrogenase (short-subunit alcohol dehydrogenase family)
MKKRIHDLFDLEGRVAVITGGAGLLGTKHAEAVAEFGGISVLLDVKQDLVQQTAKTITHEYGTTCLGLVCDITCESELLKTKSLILERFGRVDILINNAALDPKVTAGSPQKQFSRMENFSLEQWNTELAVGLSGAFLCTKIFGSVMVEQKSGVILNISSDLGIIAPDQRLYKQGGLAEEMQPVKPVTYSVIKHGLIGLTKYTATYWAQNGIRANTLCPSGVRTNQSEEFLQRISALIPLGRMADVNEFKAAIAYLVSDASSYVNGATIVIDGGRSIL